MKVYVVKEISCGDVFEDRIFATKELADEYCKWKNEHQGSQWDRWSWTEIQVVTRQLSESEMLCDHCYDEEEEI